MFEKHKRLGGMLRYGIPSYRLPDDDLDRDINAILSTGIQVKLDVDIGREDHPSIRSAASMTAYTLPSARRSSTA